MRRTRGRVVARWLLLLLLLAVLAVMAGCGNGSSPKKGDDPASHAQEQPTTPDGQPKTSAPKSSAKQPEKKGVALKQYFTDEKTGLTVQAPLYWEAVQKEGTVVVLLSAQNGPEDLYRENVVITADDQFKDLSLVAYLKALAVEVRKRYPDTETLESGEIVIEGITGHWMVDTFTLPNTGPAKVYRVVLVKEPLAYVFHATAPAPTFDLYRPSFEAMAKSMTWKNPEEKQ